MLIIFLKVIVLASKCICFSRNALKFEGETLRAWLTAPPVDGAANAALVALLAERLGIPKRAVTLLRGETAREKLISIEGVSGETLRQRLASDG